MMSKSQPMHVLMNRKHFACTLNISIAWFEISLMVVVLLWRSALPELEGHEESDANPETRYKVALVYFQ